MVHFQTHFEKYPLPRMWQRPGGAAGGGASGIFQKNQTPRITQDCGGVGWGVIGVLLIAITQGPYS